MILTPVGLVFMKLGNPNSYKFLNSQLFISTFEILSNPAIVIGSCFKMQVLGVLKLRNAYILPPG